MVVPGFNKPPQWSVGAEQDEPRSSDQELGPLPVDTTTVTLPTATPFTVTSPVSLMVITFGTPFETVDPNVKETVLSVGLPAVAPAVFTLKLQG